MDSFFEIFEGVVTLLDTILIIYILFNLISGIRNGFVASLISFSKWIIAFLSVKFLLPILRPYLDNIISSELMTDIILGSVIFFITLFIVLLINKGLKKTIKWAGLGSIDTIFGFIFGIVKGYIYFVSIFTIINFLHPSDRWPDYLNKGLTFNYIIWGNELLIETFPKRYEYLDKSKEKLDKIK
ncbi:MAG: CvpA family protein [Pelagibacteraceae bacterium]|jgi:membrane protein required for colicin V production|nr:CvpA family protein [Pelagibacteraceae bacterium]MCI5079011.1 CvpA family protein [Pelagibacteraceae bacterium]